MSASPDDTHHQQTLLATHRRTLATLLVQQAAHGTAYAPPGVAHGIAEARVGIAKCKATLRGWGVAVDDHPDDGATADAHRKDTEKPCATRNTTAYTLLPPRAVVGGDPEVPQPEEELTKEAQKLLDSFCALDYNKKNISSIKSRFLWLMRQPLGDTMPFLDTEKTVVPFTAVTAKAILVGLLELQTHREKWEHLNTGVEARRKSRQKLGEMKGIVSRVDVRAFSPPEMVEVYALEQGLFMQTVSKLSDALGKVELCRFEDKISEELSRTLRSLFDEDLLYYASRCLQWIEESSPHDPSILPFPVHYYKQSDGYW